MSVKVIKIQMSDCLKRRLSSMNTNKVAKFILKLNRSGVPTESLNKNFPDFLDFDGNLVTYINSNTVKKNKINNPWTINTRQATKMVRVIRRILNSNFVSDNISEQQIEEFVGEWQASLDNICTISVFKGHDIPRAFNSKGEIDQSKFQMSCANFKQSETRNGHAEPRMKWFNFYVHNPGVSVAVIRENGVIKGRSVMFSGEQVETNGDYKEGENYTYMNGFYTEGDNKYRAMLTNWGKERGYILQGQDLKTNRNMRGSLVIPMRTHYKTYPPIDYVSVDTEKDLLVTRTGYSGYRGGAKSAYKLCQNGGRHAGKNVQQRR